MRILVTGANGFIGSHAVRGFLDDGCAVGAVIRSTSALDLLDRRVEKLLYDGTTDGMYNIVRNFAPDVTVHLASRFVPEHRWSDIDELIESNIRLGCQLLDALARRGVTRLVITGTAWEHYHSMEYRPVSLYAATRRAFQDLCTYYADADGIRIVNLKFSDTYGTQDRRPKLIPSLIRMSLTGERLKLSPGAQLINFTYVDDVVDAIRIAIGLTVKLGQGIVQSYSIRSDEQMTLREFVELFEQLSGKPLSVGWGERPYRKREVMQPWLGEKLPGWKPRIDLAEGLKRVLADV
jgi:nucleoside-diphosphate-sugar epimerase